MLQSDIQTDGLQVDGYDRVRRHTSEHVNQRIDDEALARVQRLRAAGPLEIGRRLAALDREWDIDRALMANFAILGGASFLAGLRKVRPFRKGNGWFYTLGVQIGFLLMQATAGWCPPVVVLRRLGFRTAKEIEIERRALEALVENNPPSP